MFPLAALATPEGLQLALLLVKAGRSAAEQLRLAGLEDISDAELERLLNRREALDARWAKLAPPDPGAAAREETAP